MLLKMVDAENQLYCKHIHEIPKPREDLKCIYIVCFHLRGRGETLAGDTEWLGTGNGAGVFSLETTVLLFLLHSQL